MTEEPTAEQDVAAQQSQDPPEPSHTVSEEDNSFGDFGDFNDAPSSAETMKPEPAAELPTPAADGDDDDFGDFGDFNDAPQSDETIQTPSTPQEDDDFGDFGDFSEASESNRVAPQPALELKDPLIARAKAVFAQVFRKHSEADESKETTVEGENEDSAALRDLLVSRFVCSCGLSSLVTILHSVQSEIVSEAEEPELVASEWAHEKLTSILGSIKMIEQSSASVIFNQKAAHPYSHYSRPAEVPNLDSPTRKCKRWPSYDFDLPETDDDVHPRLEGTFPGAEPHELGEADALESEPIDPVDVSLPPSDVKLDFTNFETP